MSSIYSGMDDGAVRALLSRSLRARRERAVARFLELFLGVVTLVCAALGIAYNASTAAFVLAGDGAGGARLVSFHAAFWAMSAVCVGCYVALAFGGLRLLRGRSDATLLLAVVWLFEVAYFVAVGASWLLPEVGWSIASATGVANGGLMIQLYVLLPLWGPILALWLGRRRS